MDLALALIEEDLGAEVALAVARAMVMYLRRPGDQSQYSAPLRLQAAETPSVRELVAWAAEHPATDLSVPALAQRVGKSARHLTRVFRKELGIAPGRRSSSSAWKRPVARCSSPPPASTKLRRGAGSAAQRCCGAPSSAPST